jgi:phosphopantetheine adenylyltransferase
VALVSPKVELQMPELVDIFGPTITLPEIQTLFLTTETSSAGPIINQQRKERNLTQLEIITCELLIPKIAENTQKTNV